MTKKQIREALVERQGGKCFWCGETILPDAKNADIGRVTPKAEGGTYELSNLMLIHPWCTQRRTQRESPKIF
ncbi:MAG TPA: hypothetical protein VFX12_09955 [Vicinamibacterales bacterium]|nr:hypothetical protein [Vicinamibacterales bacterium]